MLLVAFLTALSAPLAARAAKTPAADEANAPLPTLPELESWRPALKGGVQAQAPSLRERALRDTALAVGSQAALASRTRAQNAEVEHYAGWLDAIYRFDQLLAEPGQVLPPVVIEARRYAKVEGGRLSTIEQSYRMIEAARLVSAPPTWRDYLIAPDYPPPGRPAGPLLPQNPDEERLWVEAVHQGWALGEQQAWLAFQARVGALHRAFLGRIRYLVLLERGIVTAPVVRVSRRGVQQEGDELLIGRTEILLSRGPHFRGPDRHGQLPWTAMPEVLTTYDDGSPVQ